MFNQSIQQYIGIISAVVGLSASIPYVPSIIKGETKPNRVSWGIWTALGFVLALSYQGIGAESTSWLAWVFFINPLIVFSLSFKYGVGGWERLDKICLTGVVFAVCLWFFSPSWSLGVSIAVDLFALIPTLYKTWHKPKEENMMGWLIITIASVINLFAIDSFQLGIVIYPIYAVVSCGSIVFVIFWKK